MKCPDYHRTLLQAIGQDVLGGILIHKTPGYEWQMGIMWDTWRVLVAVEERDERNNIEGVCHVSIDYADVEDEFLFGTLDKFVEHIGERVEDAVECADIEEGSDEIRRGIGIMELLADGDWIERPFDITGKDLRP